MTTVSETVAIRTPAESDFAHVDDIRNLGWHMTKRSSMALIRFSNSALRTAFSPMLVK